jgi:prevent-host-death family protein
MNTISMDAAKTHLSRLIEEVLNGKEFLITKAAKPVAMLTPLKNKKPRKFGVLKGKIHIASDYDDHLPNNYFYE